MNAPRPGDRTAGWSGRDRVAIVVAAALGSAWVVGGTALVMRLVPASPGRIPPAWIVTAGFMLMLGLAWWFRREAVTGTSRTSRLLTTGLLPLIGLLGLAILLEGPQTFRWAALPIKLVAGTSVLVVLAAVRLVARAPDRSTG